jgi:cytoskeletal protein CcmA (bactofilin family)
MFKKNVTADLTGAITSGTSIIAAGTELNGDLFSRQALRIDGCINGDINCAEKLVVGPDGLVKGNISAKQVIVMGSIKGNIYATDLLVLKGKARMDGNIKTAMLTIEQEVTFNGSCNMDAIEPDLTTEKPGKRLNGKVQPV